MGVDLKVHAVDVSGDKVNRELKHARFLRRGRRPEVSCFPF